MNFIDLQKQYQVLKESIDLKIAKVLESSNYILGEEVKELENQLANYVGVKHCISCANGTDALVLALRAFNVTEKDVVFVPTFTFFASAEAVSILGARIVFVDVDEKTFNMSPEKLEKAIKDVINEKIFTPKVVIAVDLFGLPANYPEISKLADKYNLLVLEDAAQGFGGSINNRKSCSFGDIATTSFFPAKPLGCYGDGGALFTDSDYYADLLRSLRFHGKGSDKYDNIRIGYNSRLDTLQAAILLVKLQAFISYELDRRQDIASYYNKRLNDVVKIPYVPEGYRSCYAQYTILLNDQIIRDSLQKHLKEKGIPSMIYYPTCMHNQTVYRDYNYNIEDLKTSEKLTEIVLSLPMHPYLTYEEIDYICNAIKEGLINER